MYLTHRFLAHTLVLPFLIHASYLGNVPAFSCAYATSPLLVSFAAFALFVLTGQELTAAKAFVALSLFNLLQFPVSMFPMVIR
jgi:uncharacterized RDD family membrane protein YckC